MPFLNLQILEDDQLDRLDPPLTGLVEKNYLIQINNFMVISAF